MRSSVSIPREPEQVMKQRDGSVLGKKTILKSDHFPGCQNKRLSPQVDGAPNYRKVSPSPDYLFYISTYLFTAFSSHFTLSPSPPPPPSLLYCSTSSPPLPSSCFSHANGKTSAPSGWVSNPYSLDYLFIFANCMFFFICQCSTATATATAITESSYFNLRSILSSSIRFVGVCLFSPWLPPLQYHYVMTYTEKVLFSNISPTAHRKLHSTSSKLSLILMQLFIV